MSDKKSNNSSTEDIFDKLVDDIRSNLKTRLDDLMSKLLNTAQEKLFDMSDEADNNEDQRRFFELMNQVRDNKPVIASSFSSNIDHYIVPADKFKEKEKNASADEEPDELSLVDQDEMEDMVLVKSIADRANSRYREQLSHLEARFEHLQLKTDQIFIKDALMPTNFCQAFNDALGNDFDKENKKILFNMFDVDVAGKLEALYESINNRLIDAGVLPQIKLTAPGKRVERRRQPQPQQTEEGLPQEMGDMGGPAGTPYGADPGGPGGMGTNMPQGASPGGASGSMGGAGGAQNISGFAMTAAPGGSYRHPVQYTSHGQGGMVGGNAGGAQGGTTGEGVGGSSTGIPAGGSGTGVADRANATQSGEFQHYVAGMPASEVGRVLGNFIGGAPITPSTSDKASANSEVFFPATTSQHFGHQEILTALSSLQSLPQFDHPESLQFDGEAIKQAVLSEIAKSSGGAVTKRINQIAEKTIDFIELIFDAIIDDEDITDTIKALLLRLQIPVIKASMTDQEFFIYDDHPARVLLDSIADVGVGITEHTDEMYIQLDKIVSNILGEYDLTTETFQNALDALNQVIEEQESIARAKEEEEQEQLLRKHARATVLKALRATTTGRLLPEAVHPLILKRWPTLMFNHYLKNGKENDDWVSLILTLRSIVDSVQPISTAEQLVRLNNEKDRLLEQTENHLNSASKSKKDVQTVMAAYSETIQSMINDANFSILEIKAAEERVVKDETPGPAQIEDESDENKPVIPANIMPGMWFHVYMGDDKAARRCKLSVIVVEDGLLMFVNHKGELVTEKTFDDFNTEVDKGQTKMIMGHSAFDHAFKSVIDRLD